MTKLTPKQVRYIFLDDRSYSEIAADYTVSAATVSRIKAGKIGADITKDMTPVLRRPGRIPKSARQ